MLPFTQLLETFLLVAARIAGLVVAAPVLGSALIPNLLRVGLILMLALAITPTLSVVVSSGSVLLGIGVILQFLVGLLMGLVLSLFMAIFAVAGQVVTYQMGLGLAVAASPGLLSAGSFLSEWETLMATFVFVAGHGLELLVLALQASFRALPLDHAGIPLHAMGFVVGLMQTVLTMTILVAAPLLMVGLVANVTVGVIARAFPQMNAYFIALPVGIGLTLLVFAGSLPILMSTLPSIWHQAFDALSHLLAVFGGAP